VETISENEDEKLNMALGLIKGDDKIYWGVEAWLHLILTFALDGG
jgi:hypothetical protein